MPTEYILTVANHADIENHFKNIHHRYLNKELIFIEEKTINLKELFSREVFDKEEYEKKVEKIVKEHKDKYFKF